MNIDDLDLLTEATMTVIRAGQPTDVTFVFAGPGHERGVAQTARIGREGQRKRRLQEAAQVNGRKWTPTAESQEDIVESNITFVLERLIGWSGLTGGDGEPWPFTPENARKLLGDPNRAYMLTQSVEFILDDISFTKRSPKS